MIETTEIKVAFQGGGAKLIPLLAIAEAVQELCATKEISVTALSGTSAGAIVASVLANGVNAREFALHLCKNGEAYTNRITGHTAFGNDTRREKFRLGSRIVRSQPIADISEFENILREVFALCDNSLKRDVKLGESKISLKIIVSDLLKADKEVFGSEDHPNNDLFRTLVDSCALPLFFRTKRSLEAGPYVDGGLFDNFPTEVLFDEDDPSPVVGVTFQKPTVSSPIKSVVGYLARLLFSSIDHSVKRSSRLMNESDIHRISTNLDTLDFGDAMLQAPGTDEYEKVKNDGVAWFRRYVEKSNSTNGRRSLDALLRDNYGIYTHQHSHTPRRILRSSLIVTLNVVAPKGDPRYRKYTEFRNELEFEPTTDTIFALTLTSGNLDIDDPLANWRVDARDAEMNQVETVVIPAVTDVCYPNGETNSVNMSVVNFCEPLLPEENSRSPYTLSRTQYLADGLLELMTNGGDVLGIGNSTEFVHEESHIIIFVPEEFPPIQATTEDPRKFENISEKELARFGRCPGGFRAHGWKTNSLKENEFFSLNLTI